MQENNSTYSYRNSATANVIETTDESSQNFQSETEIETTSKANADRVDSDLEHTEAIHDRLNATILSKRTENTRNKRSRQEVSQSIIENTICDPNAVFKKCIGKLIKFNFPSYSKLIFCMK